jgi:hypothetical protein
VEGGLAQSGRPRLAASKGSYDPIIGTSKVEHLEEMVESVNVKISEEEIKYLEESHFPQPITEHASTLVGGSCRPTRVPVSYGPVPLGHPYSGRAGREERFLDEEDVSQGMRS